MVRNLCLAAMLVVVLSGCKAVSSLFAQQQWSHNYVQDAGVTANDPAIIDGDLNTSGQSVFPQEVDTSLRFPVSEARIELPETKMLRKIVIHSPNLIAFEIHSRDNLGHWKKIHEVKGNKQAEIAVKVATRTDSIRIRVERTSDDAAQRRKNTSRLPGGWTVIQGQIRAPALIQEIELYGFVEAEEDTPSVSADDAPLF